LFELELAKQATRVMEQPPEESSLTQLTNMSNETFDFPQEPQPPAVDERY